MKNNVVWGFSGMSHDASLAVFVDDQLVFASHSERYSRVKNDKWLNQKIVDAALEYGKPSVVYYYENPLIKKLRQFKSKQYNLLKKQSPKAYLAEFGIDAKVVYTDHHKSHAATGYYTSDFKDATVIVIDSIGEFDTMTIWSAVGDNLKKVHSTKYPHSIGLWYSAMTQYIGLKPQEDEYILMGMAALGNSNSMYHKIKNEFIESMPSVGDPSVKFKRNLHRGCLDWKASDDIEALLTMHDLCDIAAATQQLYEEMLEGIVRYSLLKYSKQLNSDNLVLMGGCALNCSANSIVHKYYDNVWIYPNPGDAGSSVGAVLAQTKKRIQTDMFLGHEIDGDYPVEELLDDLLTKKITAVASGKAEFGPRALGNRSILADPRGPDVKDRVNAIKQRQSFRPFAPVILEEYADKFFDGQTGPYMQYTPKCKFPNDFPAIVHYDNTSRVQTVPNDGSGIRRLLEAWHKETGCPMLLNTSLNIKGMPLMNSREDILMWNVAYGDLLKIRSSK